MINNIDYFKYRNPITGKRGIFTRERIKNMSSEKFEECEKQIMAQLKEIGIPYNMDIGNIKHISDNKPDIIYDNNRAYYEIIGYEWIAFDGACDDCSKLSGHIFASEEDIPEKLHPNCRCEVYALYY